jgi:hypothetical protein
MGLCSSGVTMLSKYKAYLVIKGKLVTVTLAAVPSIVMVAGSLWPLVCSSVVEVTGQSAAARFSELHRLALLQER